MGAPPLRGRDAAEAHGAAEVRRRTRQGGRRPRRPAGKGVAHLTYHRVLDARRGWDFGQIWLDLARLLKDFARQASPDLLPPEAAEKIVELLQPLDGFDTLHMAASLTETRLGRARSTERPSVSMGGPTTPVSEIIDQQKRRGPGGEPNA